MDEGARYIIVMVNGKEGDVSDVWCVKVFLIEIRGEVIGRGR